MDSFDDERVCFYLKHRQDIEQWAKLKDDASQALDAFLQESAGDFQALAPDLSEAVKTRTKLKGKGASYVRFFKPEWVVDGILRAAISLEWSGSKVLFFPPGSRGREPIYVSVWVNKGITGGSALATKLRAKFEGRVQELGFKKGVSTGPHPVWQYQSPDEKTEYWRDLARFREQLLERVRQFWEEFAGGVDEEFSQQAGPTGHRRAEPPDFSSPPARRSAPFPPPSSAARRAS